MTNALHRKASYWIRQGIFDDLRSFDAFESRVNAIPEEKDRGDAFEIFIEGYLATQNIAQCVKHWVVGEIPLPLRERYNLPSDPTGSDGFVSLPICLMISLVSQSWRKPEICLVQRRR
jgi:hypothetical protein